MIGRGPLVNKRDVRTPRNNASSRHLARASIGASQNCNPASGVMAEHHQCYIRPIAGENDERSRGEEGGYAIQYAMNPHLSLVYSIFISAVVVASSSARTHPRAAIHRTRVYPVFSLIHTRVYARTHGRTRARAWTHVYARSCRQSRSHVWTRGARTSTHPCTLPRFSSGGMHIYIHVYTRQRRDTARVDFLRACVQLAEWRQ